jgi:hypothetical protein
MRYEETSKHPPFQSRELNPLLRKVRTRFLHLDCPLHASWHFNYQYIRLILSGLGHYLPDGVQRVRLQGVRISHLGKDWNGDCAH